MTCHFPDRSLVERVVNARHPHEYRRPDGRHDVGKRVPGRRQPIALLVGRAQCNCRLVRVEVRPALGDEAVGVKEDRRTTRLGRRCTAALHGPPDQPGDADPGGAGTQDHHPLFGDRPPEMAKPRQNAANDDRCRALDVVVERWSVMPVALEDPQGIGSLEVLPLDDATGPRLADRPHEPLHEQLVRRAAETRMPPADVQGIPQQCLVVRADIQ